MTQAERDRLVALKKAKKKLITQKEAAEELGITERHVRRLLRELKRRGDKVVVHGLRGLPSNRKLSADTEHEAVTILSQPVYRGFGPTLAAEYLAKKHGMDVSRETVRQWMIAAKLWRAKRQRIEKVHEWRPRRSRFGELVQWDTSEHDWLEGSRRRNSVNQHDRRCHQPMVCAFCEKRFHGGEHESSGAIPEKARAAAGVVHRQSVDLSNCGEDQAGWQPVGKESGRVAANTDRPCSSGIRHSVDSGA